MAFAYCIGSAYDVETGLYYLQSRYYDPNTGRFINADTIDYLDPESINGLNLYAYCLNNPIMYVDPSGHAIISLLIGLGIATAIGAAVGVVSYVASTAISGAITGEWSWSWGMFVGSILGGAVSEAIAFLLPKIGLVGAGAIMGSVSQLSGMLFQNAWGEASHSTENIIFKTIEAGIVGAATAYLTTLIKIPGFTGRGSISSVSKQLFTKFYHGAIMNVTAKSFGKMLTFGLAYGVLSTIAMTAIGTISYFRKQ